MQVKRLTMDTDFHDLTYINRGEPSHVERLFDRMAESGFDATTWDHFWCGTAMYHSKRYPVFTNDAGWASAKNLAETLRRWDPLALALKSGKERNITVLPYFRLLEEAYAPFDGNEFFKRNPEYWWQTRCGKYRCVGWPCYNYPEVRAHMLERVDDLVDHGIEGILFDGARSHIPYFMPYRFGKGDNFGFNKPVVEEFKRRYGVDLSTFSHVEEVASADHGGVNFTYEHRWVGTEPYDHWAFLLLLGEGFECFLREVRARHPHLYLAFQCGSMEAGGHSEDADYTPCYRVNLESLCEDGVIDEFSFSQNFRGRDLDQAFFPRFEHVQHSGRQLTAWLNDFLSDKGGGDHPPASSEIASYVDTVLASRLDGVVMHEAAFLLQREDADEIWRQISRLKE